MFGKNPVAKPEFATQDGFSLHIVGSSPFYTIQGEGPHAGMPAVFLRLHGCPLRCYFCDTEFSNPNDPVESTAYVISKIMQVRPPVCKLLVITGGEPLRQNLQPLIHAMEPLGLKVQVETAGIFWQACLASYGVDIVVSPKTPIINQKIAEHATAFKYVIRAGEIAEDGLPLTNTQEQGGKPLRLARPADYGVDKPIYLSPMNEYDPEKNAANVAAVAQLAMAHGYRAGLQLHNHFKLP